MYSFLQSMKVPIERGGGFRMMRNGEADTRGAYCAIATATIFGILTPELSKDVGKYLAMCQVRSTGHQFFFLVC